MKNVGEAASVMRITVTSTPVSQALETGLTTSSLTTSDNVLRSPCDNKSTTRYILVFMCSFARVFEGIDMSERKRERERVCSSALIK